MLLKIVSIKNSKKIKTKKFDKNVILELSKN
jgi:hypothetical protein